MSNRNKKGRNVKDKGKQEQKAAETPAQESKPKVIRVLKGDAKFRGAREAWYQRLKEHDGKTVDEYMQSCKDNCPQLTKNNTKENPGGWVSFFKRQGIMQEVDK